MNMERNDNKHTGNIDNKEIDTNGASVQKAARPMDPMTVDHEQWDEFYDQLVVPDGCSFHLTDLNDRTSAKWTCDCTDGFPISERILGQMGLTPAEIDESVTYFRQHGGCCDCEVWLNVDQRDVDQDDLQPAKPVPLIPPTPAPAIQQREGTRELSPILLSRVEAAVKDQPEFGILRAKLLEHNGREVVPPCKWNSDLGEYAVCRDPDLFPLIDHGYLMAGPVVCRSRGMESGRCHENIARLWLQKRKRDALTGIATGYCLSDDLWIQHSWGIRKNSLLETLGERDKDFGIRLEGTDADVFAFKALCEGQENWSLFSPDLVLRVKTELEKGIAING
jgi:hypothetical protein